MIGLDAILIKKWSTANNSNTEMEKDKLQSLSIAMQAYDKQQLRRRLVNLGIDNESIDQLVGESLLQEEK